MASQGYFHMLEVMRKLQSPPPSRVAPPELDAASLLPSYGRHSTHHGSVTALTYMPGRRTLTIEISSFVQNTQTFTFNLQTDADAAALADALADAVNDTRSSAAGSHTSGTEAADEGAAAAPAPAAATDVLQLHIDPRRVPEALLQKIICHARHCFPSSFAATAAAAAAAPLPAPGPDPAFATYLEAAEHALLLLSQDPLPPLTPQLTATLLDLADPAELAVALASLHAWFDVAASFSPCPQGKFVLSGSLVEAAVRTHMHITYQQARAHLAASFPCLWLDNFLDTWVRADASRAACRLFIAWRTVRRDLLKVIKIEIAGKFQRLHAYFAAQQAAGLPADPEAVRRTCEGIQATVQHARAVVHRLAAVAGPAVAAAAAGDGSRGLPYPMPHVPSCLTTYDLLDKVIRQARPLTAASNTDTIVPSSPGPAVLDYLADAQQALLLLSQRPVVELHQQPMAARLQDLACPANVAAVVVGLQDWMDTACEVSRVRGQVRLAGSLVLAATGEHMHLVYHQVMPRTVGDRLQRLLGWCAAPSGGCERPIERYDKLVCQLAIDWHKLGSCLKGVVEEQIGRGFWQLGGYLAEQGADACPEVCRLAKERIQAAVQNVRHAILSLSGPMPAAAA